jgi:Arylsulfotransferase (ASST)
MSAHIDDSGEGTAYDETPGGAITRRELLRDVGIGIVVLGAGGVAGYEWPHAAPPKAAPSKAASTSQPLEPRGELVFYSRPDLIPPRIQMTVSVNDVAPGYVLLTPSLIPLVRLTKNSGLKLGLGQQGALLLDNDNHVVWFSPTENVATNLQVQTYRGEPVLTYWQGPIENGVGYGEDVLLDSHYRQVAVVKGGNGLKADLHDFTLTPEGTALITAYATKTADLSSLGGAKNGQVLESVVQEIDVASGKVLLQWNSLEHVPLAKSQTKPAAKGAFDYFHVNSVSLDDPNHLLISSRNTWALYRVNRSSGEVVWQLGGKGSDFTLGPGVEFYWQHDSRRQPDGTVTVFDDGATPPEEPESRGLVLRLDDKTMSVSLDKQYTHPAHLLVGFEGSVQPLADGHVFMGWGALPYFSEFDADGTLVLDGRFPTDVQSYRAFRSNWTGHPEEGPAIATSVDSFGNIVVYMSWNGSTELATWQVLMGASAASLHPVATVAKAGFETTVTVQKKGPRLVAVALDASGLELARSKTVAV